MLLFFCLHNWTYHHYHQIAPSAASASGVFFAVAGIFLCPALLVVPVFLKGLLRFHIFSRDDSTIWLFISSEQDCF